MVNFITYLSGSKDWITPHSVTPALKLNDPRIELLRNILGSGSLKNCIALYRICNSCSALAAKLPKEPIQLDFAAVQQAVTAHTADLVAEGASPPAVLPSNVEQHNADKLQVLYITDDKVKLIINDVALIVPGAAANGTLMIQWPAHINLKGFVRLPETLVWQIGASCTVPLRTQYPVATIDKKLCASAEVYNILWEQDLVEAFYSADTMEERIGIVVLALINLAKV